MKTYELPNGQIVDVCTLKETKDYIKEHNWCLENNIEGNWMIVVYKNGEVYDNETMKKVSNIRSADMTNEETITVYGNFKLCDTETSEEFTIEEAMNRPVENTLYVVTLY